MRHRISERLWGALRKWGPPVALVGLIANGETVAQNVSVKDYSVPVSRADNLRIDALTLEMQSKGDSIVSQTGTMAIVYKKFYESLPFAYSIDLRGSGKFRRDTAQDQLVGSADANLVSRVKKYHRDEGSFFFFGETEADLDTDFDRPGVDVTSGLGFGRFINATALRKAVRIEDFLLREGIVAERLPKETIIELGHIIEKEDEYEKLYGDRYKNYWYEDMQNELQKSGEVIGTIGAIGVLRMQEVLEIERINERFYGWDISVGVRMEALTPLRGQDRDDPAFSFGVRYSRPISWSTQINTDFGVNTPLSSAFGQRYDIQMKTDFIYEITNRISYKLVYLFSSEKSESVTLDSINPDTQQPEEMVFRDIPATHSNSISNSFSFFVENKIGLTMTFSLDKSKVNEVNTDVTTGTNVLRGVSKPWEMSLSTALEYRIF